MRVVAATVCCAVFLWGALSAPSRVEAVGYDDLAGLRAIGIVVENLPKGADDEQITMQMLEDQVFVVLRNKAPRLLYDPMATASFHLSLSLFTTSTEYLGHLLLEVHRPVEVLAGNGATPFKHVWSVATVWRTSTAFRGPRGGAADYVRQLLDQMLQEFIADYLRANP